MPYGRLFLVCSNTNSDRRYTTITLGLITLLFALFRMLVFRFPESTQYLLSVGRDEDAIAALEFIAVRNGKPRPLSMADLELVHSELTRAVNLSDEPHPSPMERIGRFMPDHKGGHFKALFSTRKMGFQVTLLWTISCTIGVAYVFCPPMTFLTGVWLMKSSLCISILSRLIWQRGSQ